MCNANECSIDTPSLRYDNIAAMREAVGLIATFMAVTTAASTPSPIPHYALTVTSLKIASVNKDAKVVNDMTAAFPLLTMMLGKLPAI